MHRIRATLDRIRSLVFFQVFTVYVRYLIGGAFVISAFTLNKLGLYDASAPYAGRTPFEQLDPIGRFFRVMFDSGLYWHFIGWSQVLTGLLLMTQKFARLGALIFFVIILNIFVITVSFGFTGTPVVAGLMLLAALFLLIWDLPAFMPIVIDGHVQPLGTLQLAGNVFWIWLGALQFVSIWVIGIFSPDMFLFLGFPFLLGLIGFVLFMFWKWPKVRSRTDV